MKKEKKKYAFGGKAINIDTPQETLQKMQLNTQQANAEAMQNSQGLKIVSNILGSMGSNMISKGYSQLDKQDGMTGFMQDNNNSIMSLLNMMQGMNFAFGGEIPFVVEPPVKEEPKNPFPKESLKYRALNKITDINKYRKPSSKEIEWYNSIVGDDPRGAIFKDMFAFGGDVPNIPVEVEGEEVGETPSGKVMEFKGPDHEQGGIDVELPGGTTMFSKRIKVDGKSMADRKKARKKKELTLEKLLENNNSDKIAKNSLERVKAVNQQEEQADLKIQEMISTLIGNLQNNLENTNKKKLQGGTGPGGIEFDEGALKRALKMMQNTDNANLFTYDGAVDTGESLGHTVFTEPVQPRKSSTFFDNLKMPDIDVTLGDATSMFGTLYSAFEPMNNTNRNRAGDTPNINAFKDYGEDGLEIMNKAKDYLKSQQENALGDLQLAKASQAARNRNGARSVNTMRALDLATNAQTNEAQENIYDDFTKQMMNILFQESNLENQQDRVVMEGEQKRDLADRMDRDNYYSQLAQDIATKGQGIQELGKDFNSIKKRKVTETLLNQLSKYGLTIDKKGNLSQITKKNG